MMPNLHIKGGKELNDILQKLPVSIEKNILRSALRAGAKQIEAEAKRLVNKDELDLYESIRTSTSYNRRRGQVVAKVKAGNKKVFYAKFVEFGVASHIIEMRNGVLSFNGVAATRVHHSGYAAKPFMRPALDSKADDAIRAVSRTIKKRLTKAGINIPDLALDDE